MSEETTVERSLGRIEGTLEALSAKLDAHTQADTANFQALADKLDELDLAAAVRRHAWKWAAGVAGAVAAASQVAQAMGWIP
jgi:hypothetical protein